MYYIVVYVFCGERVHTSKNQVHYHTDGPEIVGQTLWISFQYFWGQIYFAAHWSSQLSVTLPRVPAKPKVNDFEITILSDHNIFRLQVSMHNILLMHATDRLQYFE